jgi:uncharacterized protein YoaH (UPF0181 family)
MQTIILYVIICENMENTEGQNSPFVDLCQKLNKVTSAFMFDEGLLKIIARPLLVPRDLNTLNTKFSGPFKPDEKTSTTLNALIEKYIPQEVNKETVLTTEGVLNLRKLSLLVKITSDLQNSSLRVAGILTDMDQRFSSAGLNPLVSSEEMYRVRNHKMDSSVVNFPLILLDNNPQLKLEPAYDLFVAGLKSGKEIGLVADELNSKYPNEHTQVTFEPAQVTGLKPVYGMNGV